MLSVEWKSLSMLRRSASIRARIDARVLAGSPAAAAAAPESVPTPCAARDAAVSPPRPLPAHETRPRGHRTDLEYDQEHRRTGSLVGVRRTEK